MKDYQVRTVNANEVALVGVREGFQHENGVFAIPESIDGKRVVEIGLQTFWNCKKSLKLIKIPSSVRVIDPEAFHNGPNVEAILVDEANPNYASRDGVLFNKDMTTLVRVPIGIETEEYVVPDGVERVEETAFYHCHNLRRVVISSRVQRIPPKTFKDAHFLREIEVDAQNPAFASQDGVLFNKDKTTLIQFPISKEGDEYVVPEGVEEIAEEAFRYAGFIKRVKLPTTFRTLDAKAFEGTLEFDAIEVADGNPAFVSKDGVLFDATAKTLVCYPPNKEDEEYDVPEGVETIGDFAFLNADNLERLTLPQSVKKIGKNVFEGCFDLEKVEIPAGVVEIDPQAFSGSNNISEIRVDEANPFYSSQDGVLFDKNQTKLILYPTVKSEKKYAVPAGVEVICERAFVENSAVKTVEIPKSVRTIEPRAFKECMDLRAINVEKENPNYASRDGVLFDKDMTTLISCPQNICAVEYVVPSGVKRIGEAAFASCYLLERVVIPQTVVAIGNEAFKRYSDSFSVDIPSSVVEIADDAFGDDVALTVRPGSYAEKWASERGLLVELREEDDAVSKREQIVECVRNALESLDLKGSGYLYDSESQVFRISLWGSTASRYNFQYRIVVVDDGFVLIASFPIRCDRDNKRLYSIVKALVYQINDTLENESFHVDSRDGEISYILEVKIDDPQSFTPRRTFISFEIADARWEQFQPCFDAVLFGQCDDVDAAYDLRVDYAAKYDDEMKEETPKAVENDEDLRFYHDMFAKNQLKSDDSFDDFSDQSSEPNDNESVDALRNDEDDEN